MLIDYKILAHSQEFYESKGYKAIESPWTVTKGVSDITRPDFVKDEFFIESKNKVVVASGEQSFLYLYLKGFLPKGKFQTITPCFRDDAFDFLHTKYFMKNELIITDEVNDDNLQKIIKDAIEFFSLYLPKKDISTWSSSPDNTDILFHYNKEFFELGSYGMRTCKFLNWIYGTGVAEPRFSRVKNIFNNVDPKLPF